MRPFLLITPFFPPMSRIGAKRPLHFVRSMPEQGWDPIVFAAPVMEDASDEMLEKAVPNNVNVYRWYAGPMRAYKHWAQSRRIAKKDASTKPSAAGKGILSKTAKRLANKVSINPYFTPFDRYLWDVPTAIAAGLTLIRRHAPRAIYACGDPFTVFYTAVALKKMTGLPLVLDLRDPWALHDGKMALRPALTAKATHALEAACFKRADKIILNTEGAKERYVSHYEGVVDEDRFVAIRNSFDPELFQEVALEPFDRFTVLYFGTLRPFVQMEDFFRGLRRFVDRETLTSEDIQVVVVGGINDETLVAAERLELSDYLVTRPPISLRESMRYLRAADLLMLLNQDGTVLQIPGKLYDYLASGTPILALSTNEETDRIVEETGAGVSVSPSDSEAIADALGQYFRAKRDGKVVSSDPERVSAYTARAAAKSLAALLDEVSA